ncbi:SH3 domain-containing protein, partial [Calidithermus chliarophilus]|uniref:SH3 domain-containing protein n=1 Tax=Calidithermus chliarophilus TaxID=52023 RepID=UPI00146FB54A
VAHRLAQAYRQGLGARETARALREAEAATGMPLLEAVLTFLGRAEGLKAGLLRAYRGEEPRPAPAQASPALQRKEKTGQAEEPVNKPGVVFVDEANLRLAPDPGSRLLATLRFNDRVFVVSEAPGEWLRVIAGGRSGYVAKRWVKTNLPDPGSRLYKVQSGESAIGIAQRFYQDLVRPGQDLRFYVNVLAYANPKAVQGQSGDWRRVGFQADTLIWVPSPAFAQTLKGVVGDGSITGGLWAKAKNLGDHLEDVVRSVLESPQYLGEVLGELVQLAKDHWPEIVATTVALVGAELVAGALAAAPDPTLVTKFLAMALQGVVIAVAGAGFVLSLEQAVQHGQAWIKAAWAANGDPKRRAEASKAFLRMVGSILGALLAAAGVRGSWGKLQQYSQVKVPPRSQPGGEVVTPEGQRVQLGQTPEAAAPAQLPPALAKLPDAQRQALLRMAGNDARQLERLLGKVPDPLELKALLQITRSPATLERLLAEHPAARVSRALREMDPWSIRPEFVEELARLKLEYPVQTRNLTREELALLQDPKTRNGMLDQLYQGKMPLKLAELSEAERLRDAQFGERYRRLLLAMLEEEEYVYRYVREAVARRYAEKGRIDRPGFMTNVGTLSPEEAAYMSQIEGRWYQQQPWDIGNPDGLPQVVIKIPKNALKLDSIEVPRPTGNNLDVANWELTTSAYPSAGKGGALQFMAETTNFDEAWIIRLKEPKVRGRK